MKIYRKLLFILGSILLLSLTSATLAKSSLSDPCNNLPGKWKGEWQQTKTGWRWNFLIDATIGDRNAANLIVHYSRINFKNESTSDDDTGTTFMTGYCRDGKLNLDFGGMKVTGNIISNFLTLEADWYKGVFNKQ